jgi:hypothetical protein
MAQSRDVPPFNPDPAFKFTQVPNKDWKTGQQFTESGTSTIAAKWAKGREAGWQMFVPENEEPKSVHYNCVFLSQLNTRVRVD